MDKLGFNTQLKPSPRASGEAVAHLVDRFYAKIRNDSQLGPVIERAIAGDWETLLARMRSFWAAAMRAEEHYPGDPVSVHLRLEEIDARLIRRWVELFDETCVEVFDENLAAALRATAASLAERLEASRFSRLPEGAEWSAP